MKRSDHILALTSTLLSSSHDKIEKILRVVKEMYELTEIRKPGAVSIGVITHHEQNFESWLLDLRKETIHEVKFFCAAVEQHNLAPHVAAAFAGSTDLCMQVKTEQGLHTFKPETYFSSSYQITPQQFIEVVQAQADQLLVWSRAYTLILESNKLNDRTIFNKSEIISYLQSTEGKHVFEFLVGDLLKEIQIECSIHDKNFVIPDEFQSLFVKYPPLGYEGGDREYVYLYPLKDVSAEEILMLAEAQSFESEIWEQLNITLEEWQDETMKPMPVTQWKGKIISMDVEMLQRIVSPVCRSVCKLCEDQNLKPIIPSKLVETFGPSEEDQKRAAARSKGENDRWSLQPTQQPWEYYAFREIDTIIEVQHANLDESHAAFVSALMDIQQFAGTIRSSYEEAFGLALFVLKDAKDFSANALEQQMNASGFSERAVEVLKNRLWIAVQFTELGFTVGQIKGLIAISIADVFGGMGSWNDQYVEGDQERYQTISSNMFEALKRYFAAVISYLINK